MHILLRLITDHRVCRSVNPLPQDHSLIAIKSDDCPDYKVIGTPEHAVIVLRNDVVMDIVEYVPSLRTCYCLIQNERLKDVEFEDWCRTIIKSFD